MKQFEQVLILLSKHGKDLAYLGTIIVGILATITALINIIFNRINKRDELRYGHLNNMRINEIKAFTSFMVEIKSLTIRALIEIEKGNDNISDLRAGIFNSQTNFQKSTANLILLVSHKNSIIIREVSDGYNKIANNIIELIDREIEMSEKSRDAFLAEATQKLSADLDLSDKELDDIEKKVKEIHNFSDKNTEIMNRINKEIGEIKIKYDKVIPEFHSMVRKYSGI